MLNTAAPLAQTAAALRSGTLNLRDYVNELCNRIEASEAQIHALLQEPQRRTRLLHAAAELEVRFPHPAQRPPLYGIPVGVKDIFHVEGFPTQAGSLLPPEALARAQAASVSTLQAAGALLLGKTVTTEFAYFEPGPTANPHHPAHTPGGSSSGSAAAVALGYCPLALGSQTIGSVIRPAAFCGVVGFKPSYGRIDTQGVIPVAPSLDHVGLFTQDVAGMTLAASVLCRDWQPAPNGGRPVLGVPDGPYLAQASNEGLEHFGQQLAALQRAGYTVRQVPVFEDLHAIIGYNGDLMAAEMAQTHEVWFSEFEPLYRPRTAGLIRRGQAVSSGRVSEARAWQIHLRARLATTMLESGIDLWVAPSATGAAPAGLGSTGDPAMNLPWTFAGLPAVTLPAGRAANDLPLGLQCVAPFMADERLLAWAAPIAQVVRN